jgi:hypothetical protein
MMPALTGILPLGGAVTSTARLQRLGLRVSAIIAG